MAGILRQNYRGYLPGAIAIQFDCSELFVVTVVALVLGYELGS